MRSFSSKLSIVAAFALLLAVNPSKSMAQSVGNSGPTRSEALRPDDARQRFEGAIMDAQRELEERAVPALTATLVSKAVYIFAALRAESARAECIAYEQSGYKAQRQALQDELNDRKRTYARIKTEAEQLFELAKSGKRVEDEQRVNLAIEVDKISFAIQESEGNIAVLEYFDAPRRRRQLGNQLERASDELAKAVSRYQRQSERLRRKMHVLKQLLDSGSAWMSQLLGNLKAHATVIAPPSGLAKGQSDGRAGRTPQQPRALKARRNLMNEDVSRIVLVSAKWFAATSRLAKSLVVCL